MKNRKPMSLSLLIVALVNLAAMTFAAGKLTGEVTILNGNEDSKVKINGEVVSTGRSIFSESTISTDEFSNAIVSISGVGKIELAPKTVALVSFDEKGIFVELSAGKVTAIEGNNVSVKTSSGLTKLNVGESVSAQQQDDDDDDAGAAWLLWGLILGGAAAVAIAIATSGSNDIQIGGGTTVVSPTR
ncbi:MAG: hypothetical protein N2Z23_01800 [Pyrinomonadaceae bacterium]|nr:hypothetical protein [Pyrinomonadaceae bacterium]MCX7639165.1 hypothetical protein [Pyrinomonadaceae bacterium]MDW8303614.1 hypothetical protein [Acidobacteriota bacterium]